MGKRREIEIVDGVGMVPLNDGSYAIIDVEDVDVISERNWTRHPKNYAQATINYETVKMHKLLMPDVDEVDHVNGNRLDNRKSNLRDGTDGVNQANQIQTTSTGTRQMPSGRWQARMTVGYKAVHLGTFDTQEEARQAYVVAFVEEWGYEPRQED